MNGLLALLLSAVGASPEAGVARVDDVVISVASVAERISWLRAQGAEGDPDRALGQLIDEVLLSNEARRLGLHADPEVKAAVETETRRAAADRLVERELAPGTVKEELLATLYHQSADFVRFQLIAFRTRDEAEASLGRIRDGASIQREAAQALVSRVYPSPSDAPLTMRGSMDPAVASAVFGASAGSVAGPFPVSEGWGVAQVLEKVVGDEKTFAQRRGEIVKHARKSMIAQGREHLCKQLRAKASISLDEPFLRTVSTTAPTAPDLDHVIASVNGRSVRYRDIFPTVRSLLGGRGGGHMGGPGLKIQLAWQQVDAELLQDLAIDRGHGKAPEAAARARAVLAKAAADQLRAKVPAPSEDEIASFYRRNASRFGRPFEQVLPAAAAQAAAEKCEGAIADRVAQLKKTAAISIDRDALQRALASAS